MALPRRSPSSPTRARCCSRTWPPSSSPCCRASWSCSRRCGLDGRHRAALQPRVCAHLRPPPSRWRCWTSWAPGTWWWAATSPTARPARAPWRRCARRRPQRGAQVHVVSPVTVDGVVASSSRVREYILEGRVRAAQRLLGRPFDLDGTVVPGAGRGRGIGFPTANVDTQNELRPAPGVYAIRVRLQGRAAGPLAPWGGQYRRQAHLRRHGGHHRGPPAGLQR